MSEENVEKQNRGASTAEEQSEEVNQRSGNAETAQQQDAADSDNREGAGETDQLILDQQQRIQELEQKVEELTETSLRRTAELDNARKRMQRERIQLLETSKAEALERSEERRVGRT